MNLRVAVLALIASACSNPAPAHPQDPIVLATAGPVAPAPPKPPAHVAIDWDKDLAYLPVDSEIVMGIDVAQLRGTALWAQYAPMMIAKVQARFDQLKNACGFDPLATVDGFAAGFPDLSAAKHGVVVMHGISRAQLKSCLDHSTNPDVTIVTDGEVTLTTTGADTYGSAFVDDTTMVIVTGPTVTAASVRSVLHSPSALPTSAVFVELWKALDHTRSMWMLMNANAKVFDTLKSIAPDTKAVFGSLWVTKTLTVDARVRLGSASSATAFVGLLTPQLGAVKPMVTRADVAADGDDAHVTIEMTAEEVAQLAQMLGPQATRHDAKGR